MRGRDLLDAMEYISDDLIEEAMVDKPPFAARKWVVAFAVSAAAVCVSVTALNVWQFTAGNTAYSGGVENDAASDACPTPAKLPEAADGGIACEVAPVDDTASQDSLTLGDASDKDAYFQNETLSPEKQEVQTQAVYQLVIDDFPPKHPQITEEAEMQKSSRDLKSPKKGQCLYSNLLEDAIAYYEQEENSAQILYHVQIDICGEYDENGAVIYERLALQNSGVLLMEEYERLLEEGYDVSLSEDFELTGMLTKQQFDTFNTVSEYGYVFYLIAEKTE